MSYINVVRDRYEARKRYKKMMKSIRNFKRMGDSLKVSETIKSYVNDPKVNIPKSKVSTFVKDSNGNVSRTNLDRDRMKIFADRIEIDYSDHSKKVKDTDGDLRYNNPKSKPKADKKLIDKTIRDNDIYSRAKELILDAQRGQVGYGLDKYPESLNKDSWSILESIDHAIDESVDKLHYLVMLKLQMEEFFNEFESLKARTDEELKDIHFDNKEGWIYDDILSDSKNDSVNEEIDGDPRIDLEEHVNQLRDYFNKGKIK